MLAVVQEDLMQRLKPAIVDSSSRPECLPGTRVELLDFITDWLMAPSAGQENVLWLNGVAGSGKSTISTTIAQRFLALRRRGAFLHFNRNDQVNSSPAAFIRTLSHQLARFNPLIREAICKQLEAKPGLETAPISTQFEELVRKPLTDIAPLSSEGPIIIVIDSLDECGDAATRADLLKVLRGGLAKLPSVFRFLVTSRDERDIHHLLSTPNVVAKPLRLSDLAVNHDIALYLRHRLHELTEEDHDLPSGWPGEEKLERLSKLAGGLFIWASTAVKFIIAGNYRDSQLRLLLDPTKRELRGLDDLYGLVLTSAVDWRVKEDADFYRSVLGAIVVARIPISDLLLDKLLYPLPHKVQSFLNRLRSLFEWEIGQFIRIMHTSFSDYLCDIDQCGDCPWFIDIAMHHHICAMGCFDLMGRELRFNILEIPTSFHLNSEIEGLAARVEGNILPELVYATHYWAYHVEATTLGLKRKEGGIQAGQMLKAIDQFIGKRLLYWLEVLSLKKDITWGSSMLLKTAECIKVSMCREIAPDTAEE